MRLALLFLGVGLTSSASHPSDVVAYSYDAKGRLVQVQQSGGSSPESNKQYIYDKSDNRQPMTTSTVSARRAPPNAVSSAN